MAFTPNLVGKLYRPLGRDVHGRANWAPPVDLQFAVVNAKRKQQKTTVRSDSSATRGAADEITTDLGRILVAKHHVIEIGDRFEFDGDSYLVQSKHSRRSIFGELDHYECDIEVIPR